MKDCFFLVADLSIASLLRGFLGRKEFHKSLGCGRFEIDLQRDIKHAAGLNDPGLYKRGHEDLRGLASEYRHTVVILDVAWEGSPGKKAIEDHITRNLVSSGWEPESVKVIAIDPELEAWIWIDSPHVAEALGYTSYVKLRNWLIEKDLWPASSAKPPDPKRAVVEALHSKQKTHSAAHYQKIMSSASVTRCVDPSFGELKATLTRWFPPESASENKG